MFLEYMNEDRNVIEGILFTYKYMPYLCIIGAAKTPKKKKTRLTHQNMVINSYSYSFCCSGRDLCYNIEIGFSYSIIYFLAKPR
jgi:hypothetical protein